jgi:quercetin dioxygenase-like cupin family protein
VRIYRFDREVAYPITQFDSVDVAMGRVGRFEGTFQVGCFHIDPGGVVGFHEATFPQLFMVVSGEGWVRGEEPERRPIFPGQAAFWEAGEWHESGSETGMMAVVVESAALDPTRHMPELTGVDE